MSTKELRRIDALKAEIAELQDRMAYAAQDRFEVKRVVLDVLNKWRARETAKLEVV